MSSEESITLSSCSSTSTAYSEQIQLAIAETDTFGFFSFEVDPLFLVAQYLQTESDFINFIQISKRFQVVLSYFQSNPISVNSLRLFPQIKTQYLFNKNDKRIKGVSKYVYRCLLTHTEAKKLNRSNVSFKRVVFKKDKNAKKHHIPKLTTDLADCCFTKSVYLKSILIPSTVTLLGSDCFLDCSSLSKLVLCSSLIHLGISSFENCKSLRHVVLPLLIKEIPDNCFKECTQLKDVVLPSCITRIGHSSFENCLSLTEIINTSNIIELGQEAFKGCHSLKQLHFSSSLNYIGVSCFDDCDLVKINPPPLSSLKCITNKQSLDNKTPSSNHIVLTSDDCIEIMEEIPLTINVIGRSAFKYIMPSQLILPNSITRIESNAFYQCTLLTSIIFSTSLKVIESRAFMGCSHLKSISLPASIQFIGDEAFNNCYELTSIVVEGFPCIGYHAFSHCNELQNIIIPPFSNQNTNDIFFGIKIPSKPCCIV
ncbi:leucine rich repeat protein, BspA family protein [Entamoeba histolytica HM-1:IMSS-B]|uniref:Leucine rich repeat protein, BspA family n=6 Tax=Entamoeba histolytica TaxID=5759 RepID=C4LWY4_ENTH1|nr:uncharacterized protein EHI_127100 [Entamoeba histolytica HM-1:IMSS]EMD45413.1 leucine rich repeatcontaining protein BspA family protein [Entamoeba histolytica KU27]EMH73071.1 leucine rich repeat protein, BspA family protein [Entamoeba histolytica HM-1:IMSS-B]EMS11604.1 leucine rich repeat protein, bspa family protein [Entamoeba histolytica HM-3:IMSS]ENY60061.1 leucine rich repeat protein, bspa family protein [Entamoeba histolytica HM-1:IMSS-A]GAT93232.1 leucine rich repeat protein bspa fam|eukprot:XP_652183.1 uncharacterized protein EHI_127100 [Entamoeba histolytica HM-1:IMSS]